MAMDLGPQFGKLITDGDRRKDAIHVATAPVTAASRLRPGQHVGFIEPGNTEMVAHCGKPIGIVDPFLTETVEKDQRFWLFLYPNTVTSLRHAWVHPAFTAAAAEAREKLG